MDNKSDRLGCIYIIVSAILFGIMPLLTKLAYSHGSNAYSVAFGRFLFGSILLLILTRFLPDGSVSISKKELLEIAKFSIPYALMPILLYASYDYIDSGLATTLYFIYPVIVIVLLALFYKVRMKSKQLLCMAFCMMGIFLLYNPDGEISIHGIFLAVFSGVLYAGYIVLLGRSSVKKLSPFVLSFWLCVFSTIEIGLVALLGGKLTFQIEPIGWVAELMLAFFTSVFALALFQKRCAVMRRVENFIA